jgi:Short repeat of unknown function (DUF308)
MSSINFFFNAARRGNFAERYCLRDKRTLKAGVSVENARGEGTKDAGGAFWPNEPNCDFGQTNPTCLTPVAIRLRKEIDNEWLLIASGVLSVIFGLILVVQPGTGALALLYVIGIYAIIYGILEVWLSLRLREHATS